MGRNGKQMPARPRIEVRRISPWLRAGLYAGTGRDSAGPSAWGEPQRWGSG
jgi:hypothetical protein